MMGMKSGSRVRCTIALGLALGLTSTVASADVWAPGAVCTEALASVGNVFDYNGGYPTNNSGTAVYTNCPIIVDQNVGTTHSFDVKVFDNSAGDNFTSWFGLILDTEGEILSSTSSGSTTGTGEKTMSFSGTTGVSSDDYSYVALGNTPGGGSQVEAIHVF